jgi:hypothetical protein
MSLKHIDMDAALRRLAEQRIEEAMAEGKFDNLEGAGKPLDLEPMPAEEAARMTWWAIRIMKQNDFVPEEVRWRKAVDHLRVRLADARDEKRVAELVASANDLIHKINTLGTNVMKAGMAPWSLEEELGHFRARQASV